MLPQTPNDIQSIFQILLYQMGLFIVNSAKPATMQIFTDKASMSFTVDSTSFFSLRRHWDGYYCQLTSSLLGQQKLLIFSLTLFASIMDFPKALFPSNLLPLPALSEEHHLILIPFATLDRRTVTTSSTQKSKC